MGTTEFDKKNYWNPPASAGDWSKDNNIGRTLAENLINEMRATEFPPLLGHVMKAMSEKGKWGGIEVGFCQALAERALRP